MKSLFLAILFSFSICVNAFAFQSTITESEGYACMGEDKSRKQTEQVALADAKRKAIEQVSTYVKSQTQVQNFELQQDLVEAYSRATVKVIQEIVKEWYKDQSLGECFKVKIKAEVVPDKEALSALTNKTIDDPLAPLQIQVRTDKKAYAVGEKIKIYLKGNKPFYARVIYKQSDGSLIQILPNPYRKDNYFQGGVVYAIPSGPDRFELEVTPPFGEESIVVYASTTELGAVDVEPVGGVYKIKTSPDDIGDKTRGVQIIQKGQSKASEFFETKAILKTGR